MNRIQRLIAFSLVTVAASLTAVTAAETTILAERFAANQRITNNQPTTTAWYGGRYNSSSGTISFSDGSDNLLTLSTSTGGRVMLAHFTPVTLKVGDSLSVNFTFSVTHVASPNTGDNQFRFGVFGSGTGDLVSADAFNQTGAFTGYSGYQFGASTTSGAAGVKCYPNLTTSNSLFSGTQIGATGGTTAFTASTNYSAKVTITRTNATNTSITLSFVGTGFTNFTETWNDTTANCSNFNTFSIGTGTSAVFNNLTMRSVDITLTSVPEPSTIAAILGVTGLIAVMARRRR